MGLYKRLEIMLVAGFVCLFSLAGVLSAQDTQTQNKLSYENKAMGLKLTGPEGWYITPGDVVKNAVSKNIGDVTNLESIKESVRKLGILVVFFRYPFGSPKEFNPNILLSTEEIPPEYASGLNSALDAANSSIMTIKAMFKDAKVAKEPNSVTINNKEGANFIYEGTVVRGYLETRIKCSAFIFIKDRIIYTLAFTDKAEDFNKNVKSFESSVNTFVIK